MKDFVSQSFAFKCLGVALQKINNKEFVASYLALLFLTVNHAIPDERQVYLYEIYYLCIALIRFIIEVCLYLNYFINNGRM